MVGSYAVNNNNEYSDIDVCIVLNDRCQYQQRGNLLIDGYIIEYFMNPVRKIIDIFQKDGRGHGGPMANMIVNGKILYGNLEIYKELKREALNAIRRKNKKDLLKYYRCWDAYEDYKACKYHNEMQYYLCLKYFIEAYLYNNDYFILPENKIERFFKDEEYRNRYNIKNFPVNDFNQLVIKCFDEPIKENLDRLYEFVINDGKFDINNFVQRNKI